MHTDTVTTTPELSDEDFWLAKVDEDLHRAAIVPDRKRSQTPVHQKLAFEIAPETAHALRAARPSQGVSDVELCAGLLAALLGKVQREDSLLVGLSCSLFGEPAQVRVPLRLACGAADNFVAAVAAIAAQLAEMAGRSTESLRHLPQILGMATGGDRRPLFHVAVGVWQDDGETDRCLDPVDLAFLFDTGAGRIRGRIRYAEGLYDRVTIERLVAQLERVADQVARQPGAEFRTLELMSASERDQVLHTLSGRRSEYPLSQTFHSLFETQVQRTPGATAAIHREDRLSYEELNARANRLAHTLLSLGLGKGQFVGILLHRGCDFVVAMLAVFKAGGAYVPLDPTYPADRVAYMLDDSEASFLVTDAALAQRFGGMFAKCPQLRVVASTQATLAGDLGSKQIASVQPAQIDASPAHDPGLALCGRDRAYMIYTSGSTGRPKGAICRHDGALNHLFGELEGIGVSGAFNFLQTAASSSDISVWQFMAPLLHGGATVIADYEAVVDPPALHSLMRVHRVTVAEPVPVVLRALLDHLATMPVGERTLPDLACMMCTGEALPGELVDRWLAMYPTIPIANTYGPTETSDDVTLLVLKEPIAHRFAITPIGPPLPNVRIFVLDRELRLVPPGVPGEICVGGVAVGEGYWQQPDKTAAAFVPCPFPDVAEGPMYRTGDLGRWLPDGSIEFLGRIDQQVKVRGFRIEPGEIEDVLNKHPAVQDAAVVAVADGSGNRRLVGHFVVRSGMFLTSAELRLYLKGKLAEHMVPSVLEPLRALPLTPLGKVDRRALERIDLVAPRDVSEVTVAPRDAAERLLADLWAHVLGVAEVGIHDNFFEIGGDSILTIQVIAALRQQGYAVAPKLLFRHPTIAELAPQLGTPSAAVESLAAEAHAAVEQGWEVARWREALAPVLPGLQDVFPLSATQRGIYFQVLLVPKTSGAYVEQIVFDLVGELDLAAFQGAWQYAADGLDSLRTAVVRRGAPFPLQAVVRAVTLAPSLLDLRELSPQRQQQRLAELVAEDRMKGFDLRRPPLMRVTLVRLGTAHWRVLWAYHHLILDGSAEPMVLATVFRAYEALHEGRQPVSDAGLPYREFVLWCEAQDHKPAEAFWRGQLAGFTTPVTITDTSPGVTPPSGGEITHGCEQLRLPGETLQALERMGRRTGLTMSTVLHGAWALLLARHSGAADVLFGSIASGRQCVLPGIESVRGLVAVTQPLRTRVSADAPIAAWLRLLQLQMAEMREHEHVPLALIQQWSEVPLDKRPMFDSIVVVGNYAGSDLSVCRPATLEIGAVEYFTQPLYAYTLFATINPVLALSLVYEKRRCAPATARKLLDEFGQLLADIAENPERRIGGLGLN